MKHLIEPNNADVFVYACTQNTLHTLGKSCTQKYLLTTYYSKEDILYDTKMQYGKYLKEVVVSDAERIPSHQFGTLGYFRTRMQNQIDNIAVGYKMALDYSKNKNFNYDVVVRCRPDNAYYPQLVDLKEIEIEEGVVYSTIFSPSGHRDLCFFAMAKPETFAQYCSYQYLENEDALRTDSNFKNTEHSWEDYLRSIGIKTKYLTNISRPYTGFDKNVPIPDFPFRNPDAKLIDENGLMVIPRVE